MQNTIKLQLISNTILLQAAMLLLFNKQEVLKDHFRDKEEEIEIAKTLEITNTWDLWTKNSE